MIDELLHLLRITKSQGILRRYFVVNGFDGALTMLGLIVGFLLSEHSDFKIALNVCLGAAVALAVSGISSAYVSEHSERTHALQQLEDAMLTDLDESTHAQAVKWVPWMVALVNGFSPFIICLLIVLPLWLASVGIVMPISPFYFSSAIALGIVFFLGTFLGRITGSSWLFSGLRTLFIAVLTAAIIYAFVG